jgi:hypothetical protein
VRLCYCRADHTEFEVVACDSPGVRPSLRRRVRIDGASWWIVDAGASRVVAFESQAGDHVYAVTGPAGDESVLGAAKALRASIR